MRAKQILLTAFLLASASFAVAEMQINGDKITADFTDMTLEDALSEIAEQTDISILASHPLDAKLQLGFKDIDLEKLLSQLLLGYNVVYQRHADNRIKEVRVFAVGTAPRMVAKPQVAESPNTAENDNGRFYVTVHINGSPVRLLVDTGASQLSLSANVAAQLGLMPAADNVVVETAAGKTHAYPVVIEDFTMAGKSLKGVQAIVLPQLNESGLLGQNVLAHFRRITEGNAMRFEPIEQAANQPTDETTPNAAGEPVQQGKAPKQPAIQPSTQPIKRPLNTPQLQQQQQLLKKGQKLQHVPQLIVPKS